jgi:hypothetical protein
MTAAISGFEQLLLVLMCTYFMGMYDHLSTCPTS